MISAIRADTYDGGRWLRLPATKQCRPDFPPDMPWVPACQSLDCCTMAGRPHERRTVSPVLPADLTELWVGVEQWRPNDRHRCLGEPEFPWLRRNSVNGGGHAPDVERRLALVYRCSGVTELPVVDDWTHSVPETHVDTRARYPHLPPVVVHAAPRTEGRRIEELTQPFAASLVPGDVVLDLGTVEAIDPVTEMVCPECNRQGCINPRSYPTDYGTGIEYDADPCPVCSDGEESGPGSVPLVLPSDRITEIEVP